MCNGLTFSVKNSHHIKGGGSLTDEDIQEADSDREEIYEWEIKNALVTAHGAPTGERTEQIEKVNNHYLGSGSLPASFYLPLILV